MSFGLGLGLNGGGNTLYGPLSFWDEYTTARAAGAVNGTACEPGTGTREVVDTETCISIIPNLSAAVATHAGVTFGGSNNRCSYATGYGWMDFPTGFNASLQAGLGRIALLGDGTRYAWGFLGAGGSGESLGSDLIASGRGTFSITSPPPGWVAYGTNILSTEDQGGGDYALKLVGVDNGDGGYAYLSTASGNLSESMSPLKLYAISVLAKVNSGRSVVLALWTGTTLFYSSSAVTNTAFEERNINFVFNSATPYLTVRSVDSGDILFIDNIILKQVLTPSATGCWVYPTLAKALAGDTAQSRWNKPTAFNMNSATYTFGIHDPLSGGKKFYMGGKATPAYGDPGDWRSTAITRAAGVMSVGKFTLGDVTSAMVFGFDSNKSDIVDTNSLRVISDTCKIYDGGLAGPTVCIPTDNSEVTMLIILRAAGAHFFTKTSTGNWKYLYSTATNNTATLYLGTAGYSQAFYEDWVRSPFLKWMMTPIVSHSFTGDDATDIDGTTSNGLGHAETTGIGSGGSGLAADVVLGTAVITSNKATFTALTGGVGAVVWDVGNANTQSECVVHWSAGSVGMIVRWVDANNYIYADHDGTTAHLIKIVAGTPTTVGQLVTAYADSKKIIVRASLTKFSYWFNDVLIATLDLTIADASLQASTKIGIRSTDIGNTHDNLVSYMTGDGGEYSVISGLVGA